jgi:hypothetical protein
MGPGTANTALKVYEPETIFALMHLLCAHAAVL